MNFELYGFNGELSFNIPYNLEKETLWSDLANYQNKFAIEITYQESLKDSSSGQPNPDNCWGIKGYVDLAKNNAIELTDQISKVDSYVSVRHYLSCKLFFVDVFAFIAKQHYPVKIYPQSSYIEVFDNIFENFNSLLSTSDINISKDITTFDAQYNWICVNCQYPSYSFYDFFFHTLRHYQLQFVYNYSGTEPSYSIVNSESVADTNPSATLPVGNN